MQCRYPVFVTNLTAKLADAGSVPIRFRQVKGCRNMPLICTSILLTVSFACKAVYP